MGLWRSCRIRPWVKTQKRMHIWHINHRRPCLGYAISLPLKLLEAESNPPRMAWGGCKNLWLGIGGGGGKEK